MPETKLNRLNASVDKIDKAAWDVRQGRVVPENESLSLGNEGVEIEASVLYADLADSTELAIFDQQITADVCKAYLIGTSSLIRGLGGEVEASTGTE